MGNPVVSKLWKVTARVTFPGPDSLPVARARHFVVGADSRDEAVHVVRARLCANLASAYDRSGRAKSLPPSPWRAAEYEVEPVIGSVLEARS